MQYSLTAKTSQKLWNDFIDCWASVYSGSPGVIRLDREISFTAEEFREKVKNMGIYTLVELRLKSFIGKG